MVHFFIFLLYFHSRLVRGESSGKISAFREMYSKLVDLRAFLPSGTPIIALTAIPTATTLAYIKENLQLQNVVTLCQLSKKDKIKYSVVDSKQTSHLVAKVSAAS